MKGLGLDPTARLPNCSISRSLPAPRLFTPEADGVGECEGAKTSLPAPQANRPEAKRMAPANGWEHLREATGCFSLYICKTRVDSSQAPSGLFARRQQVSLLQLGAEGFQQTIPLAKTPQNGSSMLFAENGLITLSSAAGARMTMAISSHLT